MTDTIKQCWAYNKDGHRCEHPAGHPGNHVITSEWTDDECYSPIKHQLPTVITTSSPVTTEVSVTTIDPEIVKCAGCHHSHRGGKCKCGCYEFIG